MAALGFELGGGIELIARPASPGGAQTVSYVLTGLLLVGIARAWELVSDRDTGILSSIFVLAGRGAAGQVSSASEDPVGAGDGPPESR